MSLPRTSIEIEGFGHANPIPAACRMGPFLFSGVLTGRDPVTREMPERFGEQLANVFAHARSVLAAAGGSLDDVAKMTFWLADYRDRNELNRLWLEAFPDAASRPARQAMSALLDGGALVHCDLVAVFGD
ncbi:RidA family protein [Galactobacter valiniphilus]|uniref:RidA family protein n=1 Tax=Galactobacter valiniphilus TaxID=2676122 RepID=A0A399JJ75_9MICC|nr:RidA family protein [Galactobacter valiniphilus]RII42506.1 RidA family protein [Galactobacter valiniphilus]